MRNPRALLLGLALLLPLPAAAANPHFIDGPTFTVKQGSLQACGTIAGLGNQDVTVTLTADANVQCVNSGGNPPPGQKQSVSGTASNLHPENGRLSFCVTTAPVKNPCPDHMKYTVTFSNARIAVYQGGQQVLSHTYTP